MIRIKLSSEQERELEEAFKTTEDRRLRDRIQIVPMAHLGRTFGIKVRRSAVGEFCRRHGIRPYRPTYRYLRGDPEKQAQALVELAELRRAADAGELVLLAQDEARFPMVPTLAATLGV